MSQADALSVLSKRLGIHDGYWDVCGNWIETSEESRIAIIQALGYQVTDNATAMSVLEQMQQDERRKPLEPVYVVQNHQHEVCLPLRSHVPPAGVFVRIKLENHRDWRESDEVSARLREREDGTVCLFLSFNTDLPCGYHQLEVVTSSFDCSSCWFVVTPGVCYVHPDYQGDEHERSWGVGTQLYSLPSRWGIGDFGDLTELIDLVGETGANFVGLNPLHAIMYDDASGFSPYSPVSRAQLSALYIRIEDEIDFLESPEAINAKKRLERSGVLDELQSAELVDYVSVWRAKREVLFLMWRRFWCEHHGKNTARARDFENFIDRGGKGLRNYSLYQALRKHFVEKDAELWGWPTWPEDYQCPDSSLVEAFYEENLEEVLFYSYLQWVADRQLGVASSRARHLAFPGLYLDLALGSSVNSADVWSNREVYVEKVSVGAPPDDFNPAGQDWGLPPFNPQKLRESCFAPFRETLAANMRHAGAIRIDHVMSLMRLFWIPRGWSGDKGVYVTYPMHEMMGILALESQRHRSMVIGEDLGTVAQEVRDEMRKRNILSYKVFIFMKDHEGKFLPSSSYDSRALVSAATHDLPTLAGYRRGFDIDIRQQLGHFSTQEEKGHVWQQRLSDLGAMECLLREQGLYDGPPFSDELSTDDELAYVSAVEQLLARTPCLLELVQLEDILLVQEQVNFPGTVDEQPNWRRRLGLSPFSESGKKNLLEIGKRLSSEGRTNTKMKPIGRS